MNNLIILDNLRTPRASEQRSYPMRHDELYQALGLDPKKHLPNEGVPETMVGNVAVWVVPKTEQPQDAARTWCRCPRCQKVLTVGKLQQHLKVHSK